MSITMKETAALVVKYQKDKYGWDTTIDEILINPWHKVVGYGWVAKTYYRMQKFYESLDEVKDPQEGMSVMILVDETSIDNFIYRNGKWSHNSKLTIDMYK